MLELRPVESVLLADSITGEGAVAHTQKGHVAACRRAEHVAGAGRVERRLRGDGKERVARPEADSDVAGLDEPESHHTRRIVTTADRDQGVSRETVALYKPGRRFDPRWPLARPAVVGAVRDQAPWRPMPQGSS